MYLISIKIYIIMKQFDTIHSKIVVCVYGILFKITYLWSYVTI